MNKPDIRFNGFDEEWEEKNYKEVFDTSVSNNTLSRAELTSERTSTKNVHYGDILIKYNSILDANKDDFPFIPETVKVDSKNFLKDGDIVFADTAEDETCGKATELNNIDNEKLVAGLHTFVARPKLQFQSKYLGYFINSPAYHNQLFPYMQGTKVTSISKTSIQKTWINFPSPTEQSKIGSLFSQIDSLIASTQKEHDKLVALKKCMLQKMFPRPRHSQLDSEPLVPEIRFKGFSGDWEEKRLGEVAEKVTKKNANTIYVETFTNSAEQGIVSQRDYFDHDISNIENIDSYYIVENDVFVYNPRISTLAPVGPINRNKLGRTGVMSPLYTVFKTHDIKNEYLEWYFKSTCWHPFMYFNGDTGARSDRFSIKDNKFFEMPIMIPDETEQQKIGSYFQNLDNLISKQAAELEKLKNVKKTLLGKMFV